MIYRLNLSIRPNPLLPWIHVFMYLSIKQFSLVYDKLDFPFDPPEDLRQLAHDFAFTFAIMHRGSDHAAATENLLRSGEIASVDLLEGTSADDPYEKRRDALFTNSFAHLERLGYAEAVYRWGKQTHTYYKYTDRERYADFDALSDWCHLLRKWAVLEQLKQPVTPEHVPHGLYSAGWDELVAKFAPIYTGENLSLEPLPISSESRITLPAIVLHYETKKLDLETTTDQMMESSKSVWEDFALGPGGSYLSFRLEGRLRINLREWNMIMDALSTDDMHIMEQWALKDTYKWRNLKVPFPDFRASSDLHPE